MTVSVLSRVLQAMVPEMFMLRSEAFMDIMCCAWDRYGKLRKSEGESGCSGVW